MLKSYEMKRSYYGWWNVAAAFLALFFILGVPAFMMPVLYGAIIDETGWSRGDVTVFATFKYGAGAVACLASGFLIDIFGIKRLMALCAVITGFALLGFLFMESLWQFYLIAAVLGISALATAVAMKVLVARWFVAHLGVAVAIGFLGISAAGMTVPVIVTKLTSMFDWRIAAASMTIGLWLIMLPFYLLRSKDYPDENDLAEKNTESAAEPVTQEAHPTLSKIIRHPAFWIICIANIMIGFVDASMTQNVVLYLDRDVKLGAETAAIGFSFIALMSNVGKLGFGWLFDRTSVKGIMFCWFAIALGVALAFPISGLISFLIFGIVRGTSQGGILVEVPIFCKHCFGDNALAKTMGLLTMSNMIGSSIGPLVIGRIYDMTGSYTEPFMIMIAMAIIAALMLIGIKTPYWKRPGKQNSGESGEVPA